MGHPPRVLALIAVLAASPVWAQQGLEGPALADEALAPVEATEGRELADIDRHAESLRQAALAFARTGSAEDRAAGQAGLADLAGELIAGPELATRDAGVGIVALCAWADATGDEAALGVALATAEWALSDRQLEGSGFSQHGDPLAAPALADSVAMGHALLALHGSTGDPTWLAEAQATAGFLGSRFLSGGPGFATVSALDVERQVVRSENLDTVAFVAWLGHVTGDPRWSGMARHGLAGLKTAPDRDGATAAAQRALDERPVHLVVIGPRDDVPTAALFDAARALPLEHRWLEWRDPAGWLNHPAAVPLPLEGPPRAWLCDGLDCGEPLFSADEVTGLRVTLEESPLAEGETTAE